MEMEYTHTPLYTNSTTTKASYCFYCLFTVYYYKKESKAGQIKPKKFSCLNSGGQKFKVVSVVSDTDQRLSGF